MITTIKVSEETKRLLDIKKKSSKKTYDEIVKESLKKELFLKEQYGKYDLGGFDKKKDRLEFDETD